MDASNLMTPANQQKRLDRKRKRKAVLAGGVVLGLGAAVTLAAWSDDVFADGVFSTGDKFTIEGSTEALGSATIFNAARTSDDALSLTFPLGDLSPGDTVYAPLTIKTTDDTTTPGKIVQVSTAANGGMAAALTYTIAANASSCTGATDGTGWIASSHVNAATDPVTIPTALAAEGDSPVGLCIAVSLLEANKDLVVGNTTTDVVDDTTVTWQFHAEQD